MHVNHASPDPHPKLHVLYIAAIFPPLNAIATVRTWNTACALAARGWNVTVLTVPPTMWRHRNADDHPSPHRPGTALHFIHASPPLAYLNPDLYTATPPHLLSPLYLLSVRPFNPFKTLVVHAWGFAAHRAARALLSWRPNLILADGGPPLGCYLAAYSLARYWKIPYVLDYRDLWSVGNPHKQTFHNYWQRPIERKLVKHAAGIVTVSHGLARTLMSAFSLPPRKVHVITNGYNAHRLQNVPSATFDEPAIVYAGTLYPPLRTLKPVLMALKRLDTPTLRWQFHYYGAQGDLVRKDAAELGMLSRVTCHGRVPWSEAVAALKGAHCAVVVVSVNSEAATELGVLTGKLFELLGLGVPILMVAPRNAEAREYLFGHGEAYCADEVTDMAEYLRSLLGRDPKRYTPPKECSWDTLGDVWDSVLRGVIEDGNYIAQ
ncbi:glycosyltransferase [Limisphaera sp. VF-2]|uniref:glycosyltransferase n=1 Tax=Limisphaera sp. VF-2 TaxID=3400418 RepID=UPI003C2963A1